jgi:hypothetical protein
MTVPVDEDEEGVDGEGDEDARGETNEDRIR